MSKIFRVVYSSKSIDDLTSMYNYIADSYLDIDAAFNQVERIQEKAESLETLPKRHKIIELEPLSRDNMRSVVVNNFRIFYLINDKYGEVRIIRILYSGRNVEEILGKVSSPE